MNDPPYTYELVDDARREVAALDPTSRNRIFAKLERLRGDPLGFDTTDLAGSSGSRRLRVGDYRVVYTIDEERQVIQVYRIGHRRDVYRQR